MISHYFHLTAGAPADQLIKKQSFYRGLGNVPRFFLGHPSQVWGDLDERSAARLHRGKRTIFMIRDPRDAAISQLFHRNFRSDRPAATPSVGSVTEQRPFRDPSQLYGTLQGVLESLARIEAVASRLPGHLIVTYEGLKADPHRGLGEILRFVGSEPNAQAVAAAVAHCRFAAMRERERHDQPQACALRAFDPAEPQSYKARRGAIGGYVAYLTAEERGAVDGLVARHLSPRLSSILQRRTPTVHLLDREFRDQEPHFTGLARWGSLAALISRGEGFT
jgi:hypothetical protein